MSLSMWLPMVYIYFFIWWWLHLTYNVRSWINEAMETNSCSMKHIFISELGIYFVFLCTCILCALYVLIKPYKHDLWINVEDMTFRCIWWICMGNFFLEKKILHQIIIMIINLHYICINLSNWLAVRVIRMFTCSSTHMNNDIPMPIVFVVQYYDVHAHAFVKDRWIYNQSAAVTAK